MYKRQPFYTLNIISGTISVEDLKKTAARYQASVTEYLNAVLLYALMLEQKEQHPFRERPLKLAMPVNLRRFFPSKTMRNFISMVYPSIDPRMGDYTFEDIITQVHHYMRYYLNNKFLNADITTNAATQRHPVIRIVPLFIKDLFVRQFYIRIQDKQLSLIHISADEIILPHIFHRRKNQGMMREQHIRPHCFRLIQYLI